ncbi:30S ribosomal protein S13- chloroplastic [Striga hermonthica]|uniref:30S ribosomal protein S13- chloroplastic n=1 Tax=Striga hermonthica TaxID=68872 RepID=A0A9N7R2E7_STRHE|nr:30S ribosomal protein S13- chloroplastic [Striga hermonthica]
MASKEILHYIANYYSVKFVRHYIMSNIVICPSLHHYKYNHSLRTRSRQILNDLNFDNKLTKDLSEEELTILRGELSKYMIEGDFRRFNAMAIKRLKDIQCYRGIRHIQGLPCRGQRTRNNCRTLKGKAVAIPGKKKTTKK